MVNLSKKNLSFDTILTIFYILTFLTNSTYLDLENLFFIFYLSYYKKSFTLLEKLIYSNLYTNLTQKKHFYALNLKYHTIKANPHSNNILLNILENSLYFNNSLLNLFIEVLRDINTNRRDFKNGCYLSLLCVLLQFNIMVTFSRNIRRKLFHFFIFFYFHRTTEFKMKMGILLIYLLKHISTFYDTKCVFEDFLLEKDKGKYIISHIILLESCIYPWFIYEESLYRANLISICILDSFASIAGRAMDSKRKTLVGSFVGLISCLCCDYMFGYKNFYYYLIACVIEYKTEMNDNLILTFGPLFYLTISNKKIG